MVQVTQIVTSEEIDSITPQSNKNIEILGFVDRAEIPDTYFDAPYLVAPDSPASGKTYALLKAVMERTGKVAIGKVILREREDPVAISATPEGLIIQTLRYAREVRNLSALSTQSSSEVSNEELELVCGFGHKVKFVGHKMKFVGHKVKLVGYILQRSRTYSRARRRRAHTTSGRTWVWS